MSAYVIFIREETLDADELAEYMRTVGAASAGHHMKSLTRPTAFRIIEGGPMEAVIVLEFPSREDAERWHDSDAYQAAAVHRKAGARSRGYIVDGV